MSGLSGDDGTGQPGQALRACLTAATAAPSIYNTQPWLFRVRGDVVDVIVDRRRQLATLDPEGREMFVSVGAAVFNLRLAVRAHGHETRVRLLPEATEPDLVASVSIGRPVAVPAGILALADAIPRRHTNRRPFADRPVPFAVMQELDGATAAEGASLLVADSALREGVLSLTRTADNRLRASPHYRAELAAWTRPGGIGRRDGVPREAFGPRATDSSIPLRDFGLGHEVPTATVDFEPDPTIVLLFTRGDTTVDWLRAGAALERLLLTATIRGLAATPLSQLVEVPKLRALLADTGAKEVVQTVLRIGHPTVAVRATPRRDIEEVILPPPRTA